MISGMLKCNVGGKKREFSYVTVEEIFLLCFRQMVYMLWLKKKLVENISTILLCVFGCLKIEQGTDVCSIINVHPLVCL
jgi:hypothetical protein